MLSWNNFFRNVDNIIILLLVPLVGGKMVALNGSSTRRSSTHTLLERSEYNIFKSCDDNAITLANLPSSVAGILREDGPSHLNVSLVPDKAVEYLQHYPNVLGLDISNVSDPCHCHQMAVHSLGFVSANPL